MSEDCQGQSGSKQVSRYQGIIRVAFLERNIQSLLLLYNLQDYIISLTSNFKIVSYLLLLPAWRNKYFWIACHSPDTTWADQPPWDHVFRMMTGIFHIHYEAAWPFHDLSKNVSNSNPLNNFIIPARKLVRNDWWLKEVPQSPITSLHFFLCISPVSAHLWPFHSLSSFISQPLTLFFLFFLIPLAVIYYHLMSSSLWYWN